MAKKFMDLSVIVLDTNFILVGTRLWREISLEEMTRLSPCKNFVLKNSLGMGF